jgi:hypothetical protein
MSAEPSYNMCSSKDLAPGAEVALHQKPAGRVGTHCICKVQVLLLCNSRVESLIIWMSPHSLFNGRLDAPDPIASVNDLHRS